MGAQVLAAAAGCSNIDAAWMAGAMRVGMPLSFISPLRRRGKCSPCQLAGYFSSSSCNAALVGKRGRKVSHMTASSPV